MITDPMERSLFLVSDLQTHLPALEFVTRDGLSLQNMCIRGSDPTDFSLMRHLW